MLLSMETTVMGLFVSHRFSQQNIEDFFKDRLGSSYENGGKQSIHKRIYQQVHQTRQKQESNAGKSQKYRKARIPCQDS